MHKASRILVAALALTAVSGCKPLDDTMVAIFGRSMRDQRSFDPYENTLAPPENAVAFSYGNASSHLGEVNVGEPERFDEPYFTQADMIPVGVGNEKVQSLVNPFSRDDEEALARGREMYDRICAVCHGLQGIGAQAYIAAKHPVLAAYNLAGPQVQGYTDPYIYGMIRVGRGLMPPWGHQIRPIDRWAIVTYVRQLQDDFNASQGGGE
ncbi:MAG: c-type cytochrome [Gemmatimonadota bacterium]